MVHDMVTWVWYYRPDWGFIGTLVLGLAGFALGLAALNAVGNYVEKRLGVPGWLAVAILLSGAVVGVISRERRQQDVRLAAQLAAEVEGRVPGRTPGRVLSTDGHGIEGRARR